MLRQGKQLTVRNARFMSSALTCTTGRAGLDLEYGRELVKTQKDKDNDNGEAHHG